ncbi:phage tail assembly chaperone family protein, TAC [Variovorax saccharolyticus]|uniref:phage tail assembly chaperone family protein, TAC n=1 Tax=Variovorax saccharolyticus TaxID=3053516 RepID=UPI0025769EC6|nr:phage tail assembly chaperone family protein, TAC [Variovorax sp. J31P216]MDM0024075.1 phage tail assembly chaperone family protein, TAC [Variovorax sp. J31P216]
MSKYEAFFVSAQVHERKITLADGSEHSLFFKELPASIYRKFQIAEQSDDEDVRAGSMAKLISSSLCEEDGSEAMTYEQALKLKASAANALLDAVLEVNGRKSGNA